MSRMSLEDELLEADILIYDSACPNCGGPASDSRLKRKCPCTACVKEAKDICKEEEIVKILKRSGRLRSLSEVYDFTHRYRSLQKFFKRCVGNEPWSIQRLWLKRIAKESSFAMIAPTGVGKTTFGLVVAMYLAMRGHKSYIIVPTTTLASQVAEKLEELSSRADVVIQPLVIHSRLKKREREALEKRLSGPGNFDILVTTSNYLLRNPEKILRHDFKFIFVDDVDAILRGSRAINYLLQMAGFSQEDFELGIKAIRIKRELALTGGREDLAEKLKRIEERFARKRKRTGKILVIASATGNPRGLRVRLFRELLGFEIGARPEFIRNIEDLFTHPAQSGMEGTVLEAVRKLGGGGLVYVPVDKGVEYAEHLANFLREHGIKAEALHSKKVSAIDSFVAGELQVLVGVATYYGVLVRGLDLPEIVRYAVFAGPPRHKVGLKLKDIKPHDVLRLLPIVRDAVEDEDLRRDLEGRNARLRRLLMRGGAALTQTLTSILAGEKGAETRGERLFLETYEKLKELLSKPEVVEGIKHNPNVAVVEDGGELYVLIPDAATYIQASGRTSRLFLGGISKGVSLVIVDDGRLLRGLERRLRWVFEDFRFKELKEVNIKEVLKEVDRTRELIRKIKAGETPKELVKSAPIELKTALLVVESPNKARTIARFFGKPSMRGYGRLRVYEASLGGYTLLITATQGHIYDVVTSLPGRVKHIYGVAIREGREPRFIPYYGTIKKCLKCGTQFVTPHTKGGRNVCPVCGSEEVIDKKE
ncbi:MAG: reverse gyrase, partial [Desulfurococcales archaeon]|nr:reverse gyrase [Desulfurococcales archaeon]